MLPLISMLILGVIFIVLTLFLSFTVGKKYDSILKQHNIPLPLTVSLTAPDFTVRAMLYAKYIIFGVPKTKFFYKHYYFWFRDFNFRKYASWFDIIFSYIVFLFLLLCVILFFLIFILKITIN